MLPGNETHDYVRHLRLEPLRRLSLAVPGGQFFSVFEQAVNMEPPGFLMNGINRYGGNTFSRNGIT